MVQKRIRDKEPLPRWRLGQPNGALESDHVIAALNGTCDIWNPNWPLYGFEDSEFFQAEDIDPAQCQKEHTESLRRYVELWLATGRTEDGTETPSSRRPTNGIHEIVEDYHRTHHVIPVPLTDGYAVLTLPPVNRDTLGDERTVDYANEIDHHRLASPALRRRGKPTKRFSVAEDAAQRMFVGMLMSDWRLRIASCRKCGLYFLLSHPKRTYPMGTHCPDCRRKRSLESATRATRQTRGQAARKLWALAGHRFKRRLRKAENWPWDPKLRTDIIEFLQTEIQKNEALTSAYPLGITTKWLSWSKNYRPIASIARRNYAKS